MRGGEQASEARRGRLARERHEVLAMALVLLAAIVALHHGTRQVAHVLETPRSLGPVAALLLLARGVGLGRPVLRRNVLGALALLALAVAADRVGNPAVAALAVAVAGWVVLLPAPDPGPGGEAEREHAAALVRRTVGDALAPFSLRGDRAYVLAPSGAAAVGYRVRFGTAVAGGDPIGDPAARPGAVEAFLAHAATQGWRVAVLGAGEAALPWWRSAGLRAVPIGRDVVVDVHDFALRGRAFRNLRQAVQRTHNVGVSVLVVREDALDPALRSELRGVVRRATRAGPGRGFAMALDRVLEGTPADALLAIARDAQGRVCAFQRYAVAGCGSDLSLDRGWRLPHAPNGVDERLVAEIVAWAREHDGARVSLAFAAFPEIFDRPRRGWRSAAYAGVRALDPLIRLEPLYRFLRKFHALAGRRYVLLRPAQVLLVAVALLTLEFAPARRRD